MPYIICQNMPGCMPERDPVAMADIADAREYAAELIRESADAYDTDESVQRIMGYPEALAAAAVAPDHGSVISLPDGYVIDIQFKTWIEMRGLTDVITVGQYPSDSEKDLILDHYNGVNS